MKTVTNRAYGRPGRGFWVGKWISSGGANAQCNSAVGYTWFGFNVVDAIYLTVSTLTTEGFTTPAPLSEGAKLFTV